MKVLQTSSYREASKIFQCFAWNCLRKVGIKSRDDIHKQQGEYPRITEILTDSKFPPTFGQVRLIPLTRRGRFFPKYLLSPKVGRKLVEIPSGPGFYQAAKLHTAWFFFTYLCVCDLCKVNPKAPSYLFITKKGNLLAIGEKISTNIASRSCTRK